MAFYGRRYNGFIMLDKNDSPKVALHIENEMRWAKKYQKLHPDKPLPHITPYVFRHTCCTNMNFILLGIAEFMLAGIYWPREHLPWHWGQKTQKSLLIRQSPIVMRNM